MKKRKLGRSDLEVSPLVFGGNVFGWTAEEGAALKLLDSFVASGGNFIDTADVYSKWVLGNQGGESEALIGRWLKQSGKRNQVVIGTKVGMEMGPNDKGLKREHIFRSVEGSLQ